MLQNLEKLIAQLPHTPVSQGIIDALIADLDKLIANANDALLHCDLSLGVEAPLKWQTEYHAYLRLRQSLSQFKQGT